MRRMLVILALGVLAGCGADGEPETPSRNATPAGSDLIGF